MTENIVRVVFSYFYYRRARSRCVHPRAIEYTTDKQKQKKEKRKNKTKNSTLINDNVPNHKQTNRNGFFAVSGDCCTWWEAHARAHEHQAYDVCVVCVKGAHGTFVIRVFASVLLCSCRCAHSDDRVRRIFVVFLFFLFFTRSFTVQ